MSYTKGPYLNTIINLYWMNMSGGTEFSTNVHPPGIIWWEGCLEGARGPAQWTEIIFPTVATPWDPWSTGAFVRSVLEPAYRRNRPWERFWGGGVIPLALARPGMHFIIYYTIWEYLFYYKSSWDVRGRMSKVDNRTSKVESRTSNVESRTSNVAHNHRQSLWSPDERWMFETNVALAG